MKKLVNVVMLPTEKASDIWLMHNKSQGLMILKTATNLDGKEQHLYIISNEEIKESDWVYYNYNGNLELVFQANKHNLYKIEENIEFYNKIIATTDKSLKVELPQISESFVKAYVEALGNIKEVLVEYEAHWGIPSQWKVKLRPDNTIIIHQAKTYTREELENLIELAWASCSAITYKDGDDIGADCRSWIDTHVK